jgi:hypothetical protein
LCSRQPKIVSYCKTIFFCLFLKQPSTLLFDNCLFGTIPLPSIRRFPWKEWWMNGWMDGWKKTKPVLGIAGQLKNRDLYPLFFPKFLVLFPIVKTIQNLKYLKVKKVEWFIAKFFSHFFFYTHLSFP